MLGLSEIADSLSFSRRVRHARIRTNKTETSLNNLDPFPEFVKHFLQLSATKV